MAKFGQKRQSKANKVQEIFDEFIRPDTPGAALIINHDGRTLLEAAYGLADLERGTPLTPQSLFHIASVGKSFTALSVLMLLEEDRLRLDDPIGMHLPELRRFGQGVTVRRLLQHTSGIPDYYDDEALGERLKGRFSQPKNVDVLGFLAEVGQAQFTPGE